MHFFDIHFLEEKGVDRFYESALAEARLAMRFAVMLAEEVIVPYSSVVESQLCRKVIADFPSDIFSDQITFIGSGVSCEEFVEEKLQQYRPDQIQGRAYREIRNAIIYPWRTKHRSSTLDIKSDWHNSLFNGSAENIFKHIAKWAPQGFENDWEAIPYKLGRSAFIVENVIPLISGVASAPITIRNRLHSVINESYFRSYALDTEASVFRKMRFFESASLLPSGNPTQDVDFASISRLCRECNILKDIVGAPTTRLLELRKDERFIKCLMLTLPDQQGTQVGMEQGAVMPKIITTEDSTSKSIHKILVVTALPKEAAAVMAFMTDKTLVAKVGYPNIYESGYLSTGAPGALKRKILLTSCGMGTLNASTLASNAIRSFPDIEYIIVVGIAGGCPNHGEPSEHVRLGDVVYSNMTGIIEYDFVKHTPDGAEIRSSLQKPSAKILNLTNHVISRSVLGVRPWEKFLTQGAAILDKQYSRPSSATDVLYHDDAAVSHPDDCSRIENQPKIHGGGIAAANILQKDAAGNCSRGWQKVLAPGLEI